MVLSSETGITEQQFSPSGMMSRLNLIWQMGEASLAGLGREIRIPLEISSQLEVIELLEIERRLSVKFDGAQTVQIQDEALEVLRIYALTSTSSTSSFSNSSPGSVHAIPSPQLSTASTPSTTPGLNKSTTKVARPPNAFILYRKKWHPKIKNDYPKMHNTDISILLGKQWKAETEAVKQDFKDMAEKIKVQHAADNPGYQYAPRKHGEKKRRMTARKRAQLQEQSTSETSPLAPSSNNPVFQQSSNHVTEQAPLPFNDMFGLGQPIGSSIVLDAHSNVHFSFPSANHQAVHALDYLNSLQPEQLVSDVQNLVTTSSPPSSDFLHSLIDLSALHDDFDADMRMMTSIDQIDHVLPHLGPLDPTEYAAIQSSMADVLNQLPEQSNH